MTPSYKYNVNRMQELARWRTYWKYRGPMLLAMHLNQRIPNLPKGKDLHVYKSCHYALHNEKHHFKMGNEKMWNEDELYTPLAEKI